MPKHTPPFTIRPIAPGDRSAWEEMFLAYGVFYETSFSRDILEGVWSWLMDSHHPVNAFVADTNGDLWGFAHLREHPDTFEAGSSWFLDDLFTKPESRGQGVATALIAALRSHIATHGGGTLRWITAADNAPAQQVYDRIATKTSWVMYETEVSG
jgi:GNAT superfamily N-acetyltransferase